MEQGLGQRATSASYCVESGSFVRKVCFLYCQVMKVLIKGVQTYVINSRPTSLVNLINQIQTQILHYLQSTFLLWLHQNTSCSRFSFYEFFPTSRVASASTSSLLVSSESSNMDRPKFDGASLLPQSVLFMLSNMLDPRFTAHHFYLDLIYSQVIDTSQLLLD